MRTLIITAFISADGVMEAPGGEPGYRNTGWTFKDIEFDPAAYEIKGREQEEATALLLGRMSYEAFAPVWPTMRRLRRYNAMPRYVVSTTLARAGRPLAGHDPAFPRRRRRAEGDRGRPDLGPRQRHPRRQPRRRRSRRPLPPAGVPGPARRRQATVQQTDKDMQPAPPRRARGLPERHPEADLRRPRLTPRRGWTTPPATWRLGPWPRARRSASLTDRRTAMGDEEAAEASERLDAVVVEGGGVITWRLQEVGVWQASREIR